MAVSYSKNMAKIPDQVTISKKQICIGSTCIELDTLSAIKEIGRGANGVVFLCQDETLDRKVALKIWPPNPHDRRNKRQQAICEARKLAKLNHPNIVQVFDAQLHDNDVFTVTSELLEGESLKQYLKRGEPIFKRRSIWNDIYSALEYTHNKELTHGDLHAGNVILVNGKAKLIDFGTSYFAEGRNDQNKREARLLLETTFKLFPEGPKDILYSCRQELEANPRLALSHCEGWVKLIWSLSRYFEEIKSEELDLNSDCYTIRSILFEISTLIATVPTLDFDGISNQLHTNIRFGKFSREFYANVVAACELEMDSRENASVPQPQGDLGDLLQKIRKLLPQVREKYIHEQHGGQLSCLG